MNAQPDINEVNRDVIAQFRANRGNVTSGRFAGSKLLLLTTKGAKTGASRVNPVMYYKDGERFVVFASKRGAPTNPDWYHNLVVNPNVTVEVGEAVFQTKARIATGEERQRIWDAAVKLHPFLAQHQSNTMRQIPVILLAPPS
jgi:deazaflavin-dependent oxidoreductase (nitroreductase family)